MPVRNRRLAGGAWRAARAAVLGGFAILGGRARLALALLLAAVLHAGSAMAAPLTAADWPPAEVELALCEFADMSRADAPGACAAAENDDVAAPEPSPIDAAQRVAPMCGNAAASVAAVPEVPEVDRGQFEPARCDIQRLLALLRSDDRARSVNMVSGSGEKPEPTPARSQPQRFDAACAGGAQWPLASAPALIALGAPRGLVRRRGHASRIERPPSRG